MEKYNIEEYIREYIKENLKNIDYELNDILLLIASHYNVSKEKIYINMKDIKLNCDEKNKLDNILNKYYIEKIPLEYITNKKYFFNEEYFVNESVLIPRHDTEILVEKVIEYIKKYNLKTMLDICTGSGCIGISVANNSLISSVTLADISDLALKVAKKNAEINNINNSGKKITITKSNLFSNISDKFDIIVSNPPYIPSNDIASLDEWVKKEPSLALDGGKDGMDIYKKIIAEAKKYLNNNGFIAFEIGYDELDKIKEIFKKQSEYVFMEEVKDLAKNDRVVIYRLCN